MTMMYCDLHSTAPSADRALFLLRERANTREMLPQVPPRPLRALSVPVFGVNLRATAPGPSDSTGEPSCSTDLVTKNTKPNEMLKIQ